MRWGVCNLFRQHLLIIHSALCGISGSVFIIFEYWSGAPHRLNAQIQSPRERGRERREMERERKAFTYPSISTHLAS